MICENCGCENPNNARFCRKCGKTFKNTVLKDSRGVEVKEKNMILAFLISFFLPGMGVAYGGNVKTGVFIFGVAVIFVILSNIVPFFIIISIFSWLYGFYGTYNEVKYANGQQPDVVWDWRRLSNFKRILLILSILIIVMVVYGSCVSILNPSDNVEIDEEGESDLLDVAESIINSNSSDDDFIDNQNGYVVEYDESDSDVEELEYTVDDSDYEIDNLSDILENNSI